MTTTKTISTLMLASALFLGATSAQAADRDTRGQVSVSGQSTKAIVAGPVSIHAYSGFSGGTIYTALAVTGTDADCKGEPVSGTTAAVRADSVLDYPVAAGQIACLTSSTSRTLELLWHAQEDAPTPAPAMIANTTRRAIR